MDLRLNNDRDALNKQILELNQRLIDTQNLLSTKDSLVNKNNQSVYQTNEKLVAKDNQSLFQSDWTTYVSEKWGFQIKYPSEWATTINTGQYGEINQETVGGVSWILNIVPEKVAEYRAGQYEYSNGVFADITYQVSAKENKYNLQTLELFKKLIDEGNFNREDPNQVEVLGAACWFRSNINRENLAKHIKVFDGMQMVDGGWQSCIPGGGAKRGIVYATSDMVYEIGFFKTSTGQPLGDGEEWEQLLEKMAETFQVIND